VHHLLAVHHVTHGGGVWGVRSARSPVRREDARPGPIRLVDEGLDDSSPCVDEPIIHL